MSRRAAAWLAWSACAFSLALLVAGIALSLQSLSSEGFTPHWLLSSLAVGFAAYPTVGALVVSRRPENAVGWLLCLGGLAITSWIFVDQYASYAMFSRSGSSLPGGEVAIYLTNMNPGVHLAIFVLLLFPDGRLPSRRWRPLVWLVGAGIAMYVVLGLGYLSPLGIELPRGVFEALSTLDAVVLGVGIVGAVASVALRLWRARGEERQQIKWLLFAASVVVVGFLGFVLSSSLIFWGLTLLGFAAMPLGIGIAIWKHRLYDIDQIINRTLVYGALTALLAAGYFATIMALQGIGSLVFQVPFRAVFGQESALATVAATLAMAALFNPLRHRIQSFIDRSFFRNKYDAAKTLEAFSMKLRDETDLNALSDDLVGVVRETMQPAHVSLWLHADPARKDKNKRAAIRESGREEE